MELFRQIVAVLALCVSAVTGNGGSWILCIGAEGHVALESRALGGCSLDCCCDGGYGGETDACCTGHETSALDFSPDCATCTDILLVGGSNCPRATSKFVLEWQRAEGLIRAQWSPDSAGAIMPSRHGHVGFDSNSNELILAQLRTVHHRC